MTAFEDAAENWRQARAWRRNLWLKSLNGHADKSGHAGNSLREKDAGDDPGFIPPRQWLLANQFCRRFISSVLAAGGGGKTALRLVQFISLALGRSLCGQHVFTRCRILLISLEDDEQEIQRRIKAVLDYFQIDRCELKGWMFFATPKLAKLAKMEKMSRIAGELDHQIRDAIVRCKADIVSLDPFVKTHALEENDSGDMDFVCDLMARLSIDFNIAVDSPHHVHKGLIEPGNADAGRGSSGIRDAARLVFTLCPMSAEEARRFDIPNEKRRQFVRLDSAKLNIAAQSDKAEWFELVGVPIGNGTTLYPKGDTIQVAKPWNPPTPWDVPVEALNRILNDIDAGMENGQRYSNTPAATGRQVWMVVQQHTQKPEAQCRQIINAWLESGLLVPKDYLDPVNRKPRKGLVVDNAKRPE